MRLRAETGLGALLFAVLLWLVLAPAASVLVAGADGRSLARVLSGTEVIGNTVLVGACTMAGALALGGALALILVRIETPGRRALEALVLLPFYITPLLTAIAWSWLGSPNSGLLNLMTRRLLGGSVIDMQGAGGVIFVATLAYAPLPFLLIAGALRGMDPALEDSARVHGGTARLAFRRITLPLVLPAALGSDILVLVQAMGLFSIPAVLGMPGGFSVAGTEIYRLLNTYPPRLAQAAAWGLVLLAMTAALVWLQEWLLSRRSYVTITGKAFRPRLVRVGAIRWILAGFAWGYVFLAVILPVLALLWAALVNFVSADAGLMQFGLQHFRYVLFTYPKTRLAAENSLMLAILAATSVALLSAGVGWLSVRRRGAGSRVIEQLAMAPLAIPSVVLALGVLWTYAGLDVLPIYGTAGVLLVAYAAHFLPLGTRAMASAMRQLHPELEDAARICGAGLLETLRRVVLPLTRPSLAAAWTLVF
ncbi:MAG: iron ABC transporter permease, partial [Acetobacteraceae bacterium]|nr:iron ABC transporter permease [Acetobacteraceae bacterium]